MVSAHAHGVLKEGLTFAPQVSFSNLFQNNLNLVNLFLIKLVRISGFSSLCSAIAVFLALSGRMC